MAAADDNISMALFCDFENIALGVRDANYEKFDIKRVLERLLLKGSIVVKKAYCDWDRYKGFKATMHEANFELIEIPHVRQSGKNSADIRLVVDALDLCYTKSHVNTFVIISGDSDFSPLVSKLRENAKQVIGVGVKQSTSDLLIANCDEFIFYDDLVRESQRASRRENRESQPSSRRSPEEEKRRRDELENRRSKAIEIAVETFEALQSEQGDTGKIWASVLKEAIKRRKPDFSESYYGFRAFGNLLEEAQARGLLGFGRDEKSGTYVFRESAATRAKRQSASENLAETGDTSALAETAAAPEASVPLPVAEPVQEASPRADGEPTPAAPEPRGGTRGSRGGRRGGKKVDAGKAEPAKTEPIEPETKPAIEPIVTTQPQAGQPEATQAETAQPEASPKPRARGGRRSAKTPPPESGETGVSAEVAQRNLMLPLEDALPVASPAAEPVAEAKPARKPSRGRSRKSTDKPVEPAGGEGGPSSGQ